MTSQDMLTPDDFPTGPVNALFNDGIIRSVTLSMIDGSAIHIVVSIGALSVVMDWNDMGYYFGYHVDGELICAVFPDGADHLHTVKDVTFWLRSFGYHVLGDKFDNGAPITKEDYQRAEDLSNNHIMLYLFRHQSSRDAALSILKMACSEPDIIREVWRASRII